MVRALKEHGEVSERPKEHAWKVCMSKGIEGSKGALAPQTAQSAARRVKNLRPRKF